jgi:hypothetical protein
MPKIVKGKKMVKLTQEELSQEVASKVKLMIKKLAPNISKDEAS